MPTDFLSVLQGLNDARVRYVTVDLFANYPMDFELLYRDSVRSSLAPTTVRVASSAHLIAIKQGARP